MARVDALTGEGPSRERLLLQSSEGGASQVSQVSEPVGPSTSHVVVDWTSSTSAYWEGARREQERQRQEKEAKQRRVQGWVVSGVVYLLTAAHIALYVAMLFVADWQVADLNENPLIGVEAEEIVKLGGMATYKITDGGQWWRLLSAMFVSAGAIHAWSNISIFWTFGMFVGHHIGAWTLVLVVLSSGLTATVVSANIGSEFVGACGSGQAFGLMGATVALLCLEAARFTHLGMAAALLVAQLGANVFVGAMPFVDNSGNTGGFVAGLLVAASSVLLDRRGADTKRREWGLVACAALLPALVVALVVLGLVGVARDAPLGGCCDEWVCTPSPLWECDAARIYPSDCAYLAFNNGTVAMTCPRGESFTLDGLPSATANSTAQLSSYCLSFCTLPGAPGTTLAPIGLDVALDGGRPAAVGGPDY